MTPDNLFKAENPRGPRPGLEQVLGLNGQEILLSGSLATDSDIRREITCGVF